MKLHNVRIGFATNSSSSHSIIFIRNQNNIEYEEPYDEFSYGHENFTLLTSDDKKTYLICNLIGNLKIGHPEIEHILIKIFKRPDIFDNISSVGVDHESLLEFPLNYNGNAINFQFFTELCDYISNENDIIILGGSDQDDGHPVITNDDGNNVEHLGFPYFSSKYQNTICRKDEKYDFWTIFQRNTGNKLRFSFNEGYEINKSTVPELIDMKITDHCDFNCDFCYQNSTNNNNHADFNKIKEVISNLNELEVLEVALGGGDPVSHPQFFDILKEFNKKNIIVNFSTRNVNFIIDNFKLLKDLCGSIGLSISNLDELQVYHKIIDDCGLKIFELNNITIQYTMGSTNIDEFNLIMKELIDVNYFSTLLLLGYKDIGRGKTFNKHNYDKWLDVVNRYIENDKYNSLNLSIDTCLLDDFQNLIEKQFNSLLFTPTEGKFSMYIDLVDDKIAKSSFDKDTYDIKYNNFKIDLLNQFKEW